MSFGDPNRGNHEWTLDLDESRPLIRAAFEVVIPAGSVVIIGIAAANRDPRQFPEPDRLDLRRKVQHLAFGHGLHRCVGAALARAEGQVAIATLLRRYPTLRPAAPLDELRWLPFPVFRGVAALPVSAA